MSIQFFLPMMPPTKTHQEKKIKITKGGKPILYEPAELKTVRQRFMMVLAGHAPEAPMTGPIRLITKWCYPLPEDGKHHDGQYKTTKPDTDNMIKLFKDCMTKTGFWKDDAQVASEITEKFWAKIPGILVRLEEVE